MHESIQFYGKSLWKISMEKITAVEQNRNRNPGKT